MITSLHLVSEDGDLELVQTSSAVTREALRVYRTGCSGELAFDYAAETYLGSLIGSGWSSAEVSLARARIDAFAAFARGARFVAR